MAMTRARTIAIKIRWALLVLWIACFISAVIWLFGGFISDSLGVGLTGTPALAILGLVYDIFDVSGSWGYVLLVLTYLALLFLCQWGFLGPRHIWKPRQNENGRPMKRAAIGAAFVIALLSVGLICSIVDLITTGFFETLSDPTVLWHYLVLLIPIVLWIFWSVIFVVYLWQGGHYNWAGKIIRALIAGSILELFVAVPIYATRQDECYCARGSYAGLVFGGTVLLWAFGPAIFLLFIREKHRREKLMP